MKPEIGSKWRCVKELGCFLANTTYVVERLRKEGDGAWLEGPGITAAWAKTESFEDGTFVPLSPAPAEPAKAAGWKVGDRVAVVGVFQFAQSNGLEAGVKFDGGGHTFAVSLLSLRPEAAPPAAPVTLTVPAGAIVLPDDRSLRMHLADARSERDKFEALSVERELELGDKEREIARLRSALRDATAKLQRRGERL